MYKFFLAILLSSSFMSGQYNVGIEYQYNIGNLSQENVSSLNKNGFGILIEKPIQFRLVPVISSLKFHFDYSTNRTIISHQNLALDASNILDEVFHYGFFSTLNYQIYFINIFIEPGIGIEVYKREAKHPDKLDGIDLLGSFRDFFPFLSVGLGFEVDVTKNLSPYSCYSIYLVEHDYDWNTPNADEKNLRKIQSNLSIGLMYKF